MKTKAVIALSAGYIGLAILANWLASKWTVPVGFGYIAPAGVWAIGFVLVLRDWLNQLTTRGSLILIPIAAGISYLIGEIAGWTSLQKIALASVAAFLVSELLEWAVFAPIRRRNLSLGVALSGTVGLVVDSLVFLSLAFGNLLFLDGQLIGKGEALAAGVILTILRRRVIPVDLEPATA